VTALPFGGAANRAILALLAELLQVSPDAVRFLKAGTSATKSVEVAGISEGEVRRRLLRFDEAQRR